MDKKINFSRLPGVFKIQTLKTLRIMPCNCNKKKQQAEAAQASKDAGRYPGVAVNMADDEDVDRKLEKERTHTLNNNPRNEAIKDN